MIIFLFEWCHAGMRHAGRAPRVAGYYYTLFPRFFRGPNFGEMHPKSGEFSLTDVNASKAVGFHYFQGYLDDDRKVPLNLSSITP